MTVRIPWFPGISTRHSQNGSSSSRRFSEILHLFCRLPVISGQPLSTETWHGRPSAIPDVQAARPTLGQRGNREHHPARINLRLKSNAIYWLAENAEAVFALRGALLSDRWESMLREVERSMSRDARLTWQWSAPKISPTRPFHLRQLRPNSQPPKPLETSPRDTIWDRTRFRQSAGSFLWVAG